MIVLFIELEVNYNRRRQGYRYVIQNTLLILIDSIICELGYFPITRGNYEHKGI